MEESSIGSIGKIFGGQEQRSVGLQEQWVGLVGIEERNED